MVRRGSEISILHAARIPRWAVIMPIFGREERLFIALQCLLAATRTYGAEIELFLLDNKARSQASECLRRFFNDCRQPITVRYWLLPDLNQAGLRNWAFARLAQSVEYVLIQDSDMYMATNFLGIVGRYLCDQRRIGAIGPAIARYFGGKHERVRQRAGAQICAGGSDVLMPTEEDYRLSRRHSDYLEALMLRGAFVIRRETICRCLGKSPWNVLFDLWQNVPFFLSLRENGVRFGFLLDRSIIALHDERPHPDTLKWSMQEWNAETVKSIILLFKRNKLWNEPMRDQNARFVGAMMNRLSEHCEADGEEIYQIAFQAAHSLSLTSLLGRKRLSELQSRCSNHTLRQALAKLERLNWDFVGKLHSLDLTTTM